jgi:hypothetical protein
MATKKKRVGGESNNNNNGDRGGIESCIIPRHGNTVERLLNL